MYVCAVTSGAGVWVYIARCINIESDDLVCVYIIHGLSCGREKREIAFGESFKRFSLLFLLFTWIFEILKSLGIE